MSQGVRKRELAASIQDLRASDLERAQEGAFLRAGLDRATARLLAIEGWMGSVRSTEGIERLCGRLESALHGEQGVLKRLEAAETAIAALLARQDGRRLRTWNAGTKAGTSREKTGNKAGNRRERHG